MQFRPMGLAYALARYQRMLAHKGHTPQQELTVNRYGRLAIERFEKLDDRQQMMVCCLIPDFKDV